MRITEVEALVLRQPQVAAVADGSQDDLVVLIHTDEGITGIGEVDSSPEVVKSAIEAPYSHVVSSGLRHLLIGEDPLDIDGLWRKLYRGSIYFGRRGLGIHALSGIDIALWDIKGKAMGKPVAELLGHPVRDRIRAYASTLMPESAPAVKQRVAEILDQGFTALKLAWGPLGNDPDYDIKLARAARAAAGDKVDIIIDAGLGYRADVDAALRVARELEDLQVFCLEEPFEPDEFESYAALADAASIPISTGEQLATVHEFRELIDRGRIDIVQPDVTRCGGITEMLRIAELAQGMGVMFLPHAWKSGLVKAASLHVLAVRPEAPFLEYAVAETPINSSLVVQRFPLEDGLVRVPSGPGLGVELDSKVLDQLRVA